MYSNYPPVFKYSEWRRASLLGLLLALCLPIMADAPVSDDCVDEATYASVPLGPYLMMMPCPNDFDCDLVLDAVDEDDDNDGILDENECFGDPEITFEFQGTFGSIGPSPQGRDLQTPPGAGYSYAPGGALGAGQYIVSSQAGQDGDDEFIHGNATLWPLSMTGHTDGSPTDAFLAVNGANAEGVFFTETVNLSTNTDYEFGVWAINASANGQTSGLIPNIGIRLFDDQNQPVPGGQFSTGNLTLHEWTEAKGSFNTGTNTEFRIEVFNISVGNSANDFAIDDVFFRRANFSTCNTDNTAGDNPQDLDSDDDGCFDVVEAGHADPDGDGILGTSPVMVDAQGRVTGQGGYTGGLFVTNDPNNDEACDCDIALGTTTPTDESCPGDADGEIAASASCTTCANGINYSITGPVNQSNATGSFTGLTAGTYTVRVADADNGSCFAETQVVLSNTDTEAPTLTCPASFAADLDLCGDYTLTAEALNLNATDNCGGAVTVTLSQETFTGAGTTNVTVTVSDGTNSDNSCVVAVTTTENTNAVNITAGADDLGTSCPVTAITFTNADLLANDNASDGSTLEIQEVSLANPAEGTLMENNGIYTFTPAVGFTGTVNLTYLVTIAGSSQFFQDNGHFYVYESMVNIDWDEARDAAANSTLFGLTGYLATVTSQAENDFILGKLQGQGWMGASDSELEGTWKWVTGPEAGEIFWITSTINGSGVFGMAPASNPTAYNNWTINPVNGIQSEPNNFGANEDHGHFRVDGSWNDFPIDNNSIAGYVIEYGDNDCAQSLTATGSITLNVEDTEAPVLNCKTSFDANLGTNDMVTVSASDLLNSATTDNCATTFTEAITGGDQTYGCGDVGAAAATLTVTVDDGNGNAAVSCDVTINVTDTNSECCSIAITSATPTDEGCPDADDGMITVVATGAATIDYTLSGNGITPVTNQTGTFAGLADGTYDVAVADATDGSCSATQTGVVVAAGTDTEAPTFTCPATFTAELDLCGEYTLTAEALNLNATDNCGGSVTIMLSQTAFTGAGTTNVTVTVSDGTNSDNSCVVAVTTTENTNAVNITAGADDLGTSCPVTAITFTNADLLANDNASDGSTLEIQEVSLANPADGTLMENNDTYTFTPAAGFTGTVNLNYLVTIQGSSLFFPDNGHFYEYVSDEDIHWPDARDDAANSTLFGLTGYLATVTSQAENDFILGKLQGQGWMGASDEGQEGVWLWVTGPEAGQQFWQGNQNGGPPASNPTAYNNWTVINGSQSEPNNFISFGLPENYGHFRVDGTWNDYKFSDGNINGYVIEYGENDCAQSLTATGSITLMVEDTEAPIANCTAAFTVDLDGNSEAILTAADLDNTSTPSSDNCSSLTLSIDGGAPTYDCDDVGNTFTLTLVVNDGSANSANSTCTVDVTIADANSVCYTCDIAFSDGVDPNPPGIITSRIVCGNDGTITVNATCNGCAAGDLRYSIDGVNGSTTQASNVFGGLAEGDYTVTIFDVSNPTCTTSTSATIGECVGEIPGNSIDDDCDTTTDEPSSIAWVLLESGEGCTSNTDDCAGVFCYGLEYTPTVSGILTSYTTGFLSTCIAGSTPLISNLSCVMDDNSFDAEDCGNTGDIFFNSSGNNGTVELTKDMPIILHQICLSIPAETTLMLEKDDVTDITLSIDVSPILSTDDVIVATDRPDYTEATATGNMPPVVTANAGAVDACYATVAEAEAAALLATTATDDFTPVANLVTTVATVGTCSATVTVTVEDACGLTTDVTYATRIDNDDPVITGTLETLTDEGCVAGDARAAVDNVADLEAMGVAGFDIMDNCTDDATLAVTYADASTGSCPVVVTRTYTITDECGNSSTVEQTINVEDTTSPAVTGAITPTVLEGCDISVAPAAVSTVADLEGLLGDLLIEDACTDDATLAVTHEDVVGTACPIIITRTYTITDACTNFSEVVHTITIEDTVLPEITATGTINACYTTVALAEAAALAAVSVTDNCDATITGVASTVGDCTATITINAQDACGNDAVPVTFTTQITGGAVPTEVGGPVAINADIQTTLDNVVPDAPVFEDVCGNTLTPSGPAIGGTYVEGTCEGTITYTYTYTDCAGTSVDWVFTYNVNCQGLRLKVFIEGGLDVGAGMQSTEYNDNHLLPGQNNALSPLFAVQITTPTPAGHPYGGAPWSFTDTDGTAYGDFAGQTAYPDHVSDWVLVTVRMGSLTPGANVWKGAGWLHENGEVTFPEGSLANDITLDAAETYYIVIEHRNHLPVLATATVQGSGAGLYLEHDFTVADSYAPIFRFGQKEVAAGVFAMFAGNADQMSSRASINSSDRTGWRVDQTKVGYYSGDFNQNLTTNSEDETIWKLNQNKTTGIIFE